MQDRPILITGGSGGIATALAARIRGSGEEPVIVSRNAARIMATAADRRVIEADVSTFEGAMRAIAACAERWGVPRAVVNTAGSILVAPLHRTNEECYRACMAANLDSAFFTLRAYVDALRAAPAPGAVVLVSSVAARRGIASHEAVAAAKGAVEALVRTAAASYASMGLRVNAVAPGLVATPATERFLRSDAARASMARQYPLGRYGAPEDIAAAIDWLASTEAEWVTGQVLGIDGGFVATRPLVGDPRAA